MMESLKKELIKISEKELSESELQIILSSGNEEEVKDALLLILDDKSLYPEDAPGEGFVPIQAAKLLGELKAPETVLPMLKILAQLDPFLIVHEEISNAIKKIGPIACEQLIHAYEVEFANNEDIKKSLCWILSDLNVKDGNSLAS